MAAYGSAHLVGSIPLRNAEDALEAAAHVLGERALRLPDGETGPRADWIVWQYPVLNACPEFEVCPPGHHPYQSLPRLRLRSTTTDAVVLGELGYVTAARVGYEIFSRLKRERIVPAHCRFQISLPTPLSPIAAFIDPADQSQVEPVYEQRLLEELDEILAVLPHDQLAIQWDTNFEFAMLVGELPCWFSDVRAGIVERLLRIGSRVPESVELGYHLCHGHDRPYLPAGRDSRARVEIANAVLGALGRPVNWVHLPLPLHRLIQEDYEPLAGLQLRPETEVYLGLIDAEGPAAGDEARITYAERFLRTFGVATPCGWGRLRRDLVPELLERHALLSTPPAPRSTATFEWPDGFDTIPDDPWIDAPIDSSGLAYDGVAQHGWYTNLDPTVTELLHVLRDGDVLVDYSGGTGILVDRLKLRGLGSGTGSVIVDSSPKFLRVALERFEDDPSVALRHLRLLRDENRLERLDEVLGPDLLARGVDVVATTNAVHLYPDLLDTAGSWARCLKDGGRLLVNSGNVRNPAAGPEEWILDETVWVIGELMEGIVRTDRSYAEHRWALDDTERMKAHAAFRDRVFLEPRPLSYYVDTVEEAGFRVDAVHNRGIQVAVDEWYEFLTAYHDAVAGWLGGTARVDGADPTPEAVDDRLRLMRQAIGVLFGRRDTFRACWTYITCTNVSGSDASSGRG